MALAQGSITGGTGTPSHSGQGDPSEAPGHRNPRGPGPKSRHPAGKRHQPARSRSNPPGASAPGDGPGNRNPPQPAPSKPSHSGAGHVISALPKDLNEAATAFLDLSNTCTYLTQTWIIEGGSREEFLSMNLATDKPELDEAWQNTLHEVVGILLSGVLQFADAAADLAMVAKNFEAADRG